MVDRLDHSELCELTRAGDSTAVAQCINGLGCSVYAGGKELPDWASKEVEELVGIQFRNGVAVTSLGSEARYFILNRDEDTEKFTVLRGPLSAEELRVALYRDKLIATVTCPKCGRAHALLDTPLYESGTEPRRFPGPQTITFPCCGDAQTVRAESVRYRPQRLFL